MLPKHAMQAECDSGLCPALPYVKRWRNRTTGRQCEISWQRLPTHRRLQRMVAKYCATQSLL